MVKMIFSTGSFDFANLRDVTRSSSLSYSNNSNYKLDKTSLFDLSREQGNFEMIIDNRLLSTQGQKEIIQETKDLGKNLQVIASDVPGAEGGNAIENFIGDVLNKIDQYSGGLSPLPSESNHGGFLSNISIALGSKDIHHKIMDVSMVKKDGYVKLNELNSYDKKHMDSLGDAYKDVYVKATNTITHNKTTGEYTTDRVITKENATLQNGIKGMLNTEYLAVVNAIQQTGMITKNGTVKSTNITVNYNPNHGVFGDLFESGVDKAAGHYLPTGIAQQTGNNTDVNGKRGVESYFDIVNPSTYINAANLFSLFKESPHATYYCGETQIDGKNQFRCGG